jgi:sugar phosphate isomerase/epimerase
MFDSSAKQHGFCSRRHFLKAAAALTVAATLARTSKAAAGAETPAGPRPGSPASNPKEKEAPLVQIGILLGTYGRPTLEARLDAAKAHGLECVQLSMDCAGQPPMPDQIAPELIDRIRREAAARGIAIVSLQGTFNMCHPDAEHRRTGLRRLRVLASSCQRLGASKIHICTGTRDRENMWRRHADNDSPEAWRDMAACVGEAAEIAKQTGVVLAFEPEVNNVVDSAKKARRLLDEIRSPHLKVTMDAANLFHAGELARMGEVLDQSFALVGKDIVLAHAKDLSRDGDAGHEAAGHGKLDYDRYLRLLDAYGFRGPLLLHGLSESQVPGCVAFLREKLARVAASRP